MDDEGPSRRLASTRVPIQGVTHISTPERVFLYHFTHISNVRGIVRAGCLRCDAHVDRDTELAQDVGEPSVKERRRHLAVPVGPGGVPADYVPFYFAPRSPMLYVITKGKVPHYQEGQGSLVYLVTDLATLKDAGAPYVFSDGNCGSVFTEYFTDDHDLSRVDWEIMTAVWWADTPDDGDRMRRRMAEFLVHQQAPWEAILGLGVRTDDMASRLKSILDELGSHKPVVVKPGWYY